MLAITNLGIEAQPLAPGTSSGGITTLTPSTVAVAKLIAERNSNLPTTKTIGPTTPPAPTPNLPVLTPSSSAVALTSEQNAPWYKNWKIVVPVGVGALALIGIGIWAMK